MPKYLQSVFSCEAQRWLYYGLGSYCNTELAQMWSSSGFTYSVLIVSKCWSFRQV